LADPSIIRQELEARDLTNCIVCIDEIQECPQLLDEVHLLIEERKIRFLLTGCGGSAPNGQAVVSDFNGYPPGISDYPGGGI
jgi:hypothetical protein